MNELGIANKKNAGIYEEMDQLAIAAGTDKSSLGHDYTRIYASYFEPIRYDAINFLEIGIQEGYSVRFWESYFTKAQLHFIDITDQKIEYFSDRAHYHFMDQENMIALRKLCLSMKHPFDIIIDDGGHTMKQQINSFQALFPYLNSGGIYVIEDLHTSYWQSHGGQGSVKNPMAEKGTTIHFLQQLIHDINFAGARSGCANRSRVSPEILNTLNLFQSSILSMHFYDGVCILIKK